MVRTLKNSNRYFVWEDYYVIWTKKYRSTSHAQPARYTHTILFHMIKNARTYAITVWIKAWELIDFLRVF